MQMSRLFGQTLREAPAEAEVASQRLLQRAGFVRPLASGIFSYLPLARRSLTKIENIMRQEMDSLGGQEITMPVVQPSDLWKESGRWYKIGSELGRFKDKSGRDMVLAMTHEEVVADLVRREIRSYRQLPATLYHIQTKWRDDPRPRAGLIRAREFTMKDSYSLDADLEGLDRQYRRHYQAYFNIFHRCGLPAIAVKSDVGIMGGQLAHEFMYLTPIGEDTLLVCEACGYSANRQVAGFRKPQPPEEDPLPLQEVATPGITTIEALAEFLHIPTARTAKAVFMVASIPEGHSAREQFVFAVVRGDMQVNETKLANAIHARELRPAREDEIRSVGAAPGYASPAGLAGAEGSQPVLVVVDDAIPASPNLVAGANREGYHVRNLNYGRDFQASLVTDIAVAEQGSACPQCGNSMLAVRGVELGNIFKLGTEYSAAMGCTYLDQEGLERPVIMGSYGIGSGRLLACIAEQHHDDHGLAWPVTVAPYHLHLVALTGRGQDPMLKAKGEALYTDLVAAGIEVLYDDREESPGVKFNDADLIGLPLRLTLSERSLQGGGVEIKPRRSADMVIVPVTEVIQHVRQALSVLEAEIEAQVTPVDYKSENFC